MKNRVILDVFKVFRSYSVATISFHKKFEKYLKNQEIATKVVRYFIAMTLEFDKFQLRLSA